ncbi:unnamed protein product [Moneuplotes crassus]|uniref:Uncharacterized protein n=1 Tax=Euplotes crassus TaxID=5936 RepID=A0AAD1XN38_EUPCR|nr:unnamed protein product [Moneuplotes crassus]
MDVCHTKIGLKLLNKYLKKESPPDSLSSHSNLSQLSSTTQPHSKLRTLEKDVLNNTEEINFLKQKYLTLSAYELNLHK